MTESSGKKFPSDSALPDAMDTFVLMYQEHTAREDTVIFPAWHRNRSESEYDDMSEKLEDVEQQQGTTDLETR